ncbi:MAG: efflux RND transporter periplasmic adaptor subunit [Pseudomonadota bacterium]
MNEIDLQDKSGPSETETAAKDVPFFRTAAVDHFLNRRDFGAVLHPIQLSAIILFLSAVLGLFALIYFSATVKLPIVKPVAGQVVSSAGVIKVTSTTSGVVEEIRFSEGDQVKAGDPLILVDQLNAGNDLGAAEDVRQSLVTDLEYLRELQQLRLSQFDDELAEKRDIELPSIASSLEVFDALRTELARNSEKMREEENRVRDLISRNLITGGELNQIEAQQSAMRQQLIELRGQEVAAQRSKKALEADLLSAERERAQLALEFDRQIEAIERELKAISSSSKTILPATTDGIIVSTEVTPGQFVSPGQDLQQILPENAEIYIDFLVSSDVVGLIEPGLPVFIKYASFPYQRFGQKEGVIESMTAVAVDEVVVARGSGQRQVQQRNTRFRIRVRPNETFVDAFGEKRDLLPGMQAEASLELYRRTLYELLLEPLRSVGSI